MSQASVYWMVHNPVAGATNKRHPTEAEAIAEAQRIAAKQPGQQVFVLKTIAGFCTAPLKVEQVELYLHLEQPK